MKLSELIETLQGGMAEYWNINVTVNDTDGVRAELEPDWINFEDEDDEIVLYLG